MRYSQSDRVIPAKTNLSGLPDYVIQANRQMVTHTFRKAEKVVANEGNWVVFILNTLIFL